jgi:dihydrofolate synthase/folylpolyglutamate synthase
MPGTPDEPSDFDNVLSDLAKRWPENKVAPELGRITALMDFLGEPQKCAPVIHVAGTNGKTSTARIIESLLREYGLTTGLYTSPSLESVTDRIQLDGEPISEQLFADGYREIEPFLRMIDDQATGVHSPPVTMFEAVTALAFATFADAPVDVMIIECGMGGTWDATNVVDPAVCVITPIGMDHQDYLGDNISDIAREKAGILKPGAHAVFARQEPQAATVLMDRCADLGIELAREGVEFAVVDRALAVGGQQIVVHGLSGDYDELYLSLHGEHQAANAAVALAAVESFLGATAERALDKETISAGLAAATSPGRLERVRTSPTVFIDAAHNPHGARAIVSTLAESFDFSRLIAVVSVVADKDVRGILEALEPGFDSIVVTRNSSPRSLPVDDLAEIAIDVFGDDRVFACSKMDEAVDVAVGMADDVAEWGSAAVVALGSVVTAADVRKMLLPKRLRVPAHPGELVDDQGVENDPLQNVDGITDEAEDHNEDRDDES